MFSVLVCALAALVLAWPAAAQVMSFPGDFRTQEVTTTDGATIHLRVGGQGPAVVLLHGFGDTGDMWAPLAKDSQASLATKLPMSVLAIGGEQSFGATQAVVMRHAATHVTEVVISQAGHWLMEEQPATTIAAIRTFVDTKR